MIQSHVAALQAKHDRLETEIEIEAHRPLPDTVRLHTLKKQKLRLKEELSASA